jgi:hypothetical protein
MERALFSLPPKGGGPGRGFVEIRRGFVESRRGFVEIG